ncbi:hypothetical protein ACP4OV_015164 [Aristida adscensionis]
MTNTQGRIEGCTVRAATILFLAADPAMAMASSSPSSSRRCPGDGSSPPPSPPPGSDFSALPLDILLDIFSRIPQADVLRGAGLACSSWRRAAAAEPALWRHVDLAADKDRIDYTPHVPAGWRAMAYAAVERSAGRCESFRGRADDDFLVYLAGRLLCGASMSRPALAQNGSKATAVNTQKQRISRPSLRGRR